MGFCSCINKTFLVILNFVIFALGVGVISFASIVIHKSSEYGELLFDGVLTLPIWTLIIGIVVTLLGFFGCCGAMRESRCMLYTYASIVTLLFIAQVTLGVLIALYPEKTAELLQGGMSKMFEKYGTDDQSLTRSIDAMQHELKCCGVRGSDDWYGYKFGVVPMSCCLDKSSCDTNNKSDLYREGCFEAMVNDLKGVTIALAVTALVLSVVQMLCICISCGLAHKRSQYV